SILDDQGEDVRAIATDRSLGRGRHRFRWNGRTSGGRVAPDGTYRVRIGLRHQGRSVTPRRKIFVDTKPPTPTIRSVSPAFISRSWTTRVRTFERSQPTAASAEAAIAFAGTAEQVAAEWLPTALIVFGSGFATRVGASRQGERSLSTRSHRRQRSVPCRPRSSLDPGRPG